MRRTGTGPDDPKRFFPLSKRALSAERDVVKQVLTFARGVEGERVTINPSHLVEEIMDIAKKTFEIDSDRWSLSGRSLAD